MISRRKFFGMIAAGLALVGVKPRTAVDLNAGVIHWTVYPEDVNLELVNLELQWSDYGAHSE